MCGEFFVFQDVIGDAAGIHGGIFEKLEPMVRPGLECKLPGPGAKRETGLRSLAVFSRGPWLGGEDFFSGTTFRVLDIFDGLSGGVVADSSTPGYLLSERMF
jgi:hypothetical protein